MNLSVSNAQSNLVFSDVVKRYGARVVVDQLSLTVPAGEITALAGVNGSGKSTLFRIAAGFVQATSGSVTLEKPDAEPVPLFAFSPDQRVKLGLNYLSQNRNVLKSLSTIDNLRLVEFANFRGVNDSKQIFDCLKRLRLMSLLERRPSAMGAADLVRLLLVKAYLLNPAFLIADEPFAGLEAFDVQHCVEILKLICRRGAGVLLTDHNAKRLLEVSNTVHIIRSGSIVFSASAEFTRTSPEARRLYFGSNV